MDVPIDLANINLILRTQARGVIRNCSIDLDPTQHQVIVTNGRSIQRWTFNAETLEFELEKTFKVDGNLQIQWIQVHVKSGVYLIIAQSEEKLHHYVLLNDFQTLHRVQFIRKANLLDSLHNASRQEIITSDSRGGISFFAFRTILSVRPNSTPTYKCPLRHRIADKQKSQYQALCLNTDKQHLYAASGVRISIFDAVSCLKLRDIRTAFRTPIRSFVYLSVSQQLLVLCHNDNRVAVLDARHVKHIDLVERLQGADFGQQVVGVSTFTTRITISEENEVFSNYVYLVADAGYCTVYECFADGYKRAINRFGLADVPERGIENSAEEAFHCAIFPLTINSRHYVLIALPNQLIAMEALLQNSSSHRITALGCIDSLKPTNLGTTKLGILRAPWQHEAKAACLYYCEENKVVSLVKTSDPMKTIAAYNLATIATTKTIRLTCFEFSHAMQCIVLGWSTGVVDLFHPATGERLRSLKQEDRPHPITYIDSCTCQTGGTILLLGDDHGNIQPYVVTRFTQKPLPRITLPASPILSIYCTLVTTPTSFCVIGVGSNGDIRVWETHLLLEEMEIVDMKWELRGCLVTTERRLSTTALLDSHNLVVGFQNGDLQFWKLPYANKRNQIETTKRSYAHYHLHTQAIQQINIVKDQPTKGTHILATCADDNTIIIWYFNQKVIPIQQLHFSTLIRGMVLTLSTSDSHGAIQKCKGNQVKILQVCAALRNSIHIIETIPLTFESVYHEMHLRKFSPIQDIGEYDGPKGPNEAVDQQDEPAIAPIPAPSTIPAPLSSVSTVPSSGPGSADNSTSLDEEEERGLKISVKIPRFRPNEEDIEAQEDQHQEIENEHETIEGEELEIVVPGASEDPIIRTKVVISRSRSSAESRTDEREADFGKELWSGDELNDGWETEYLKKFPSALSPLSTPSTAAVTKKNKGLHSTYKIKRRDQVPASKYRKNLENPDLKTDMWHQSRHRPSPNFSHFERHILEKPKIYPSKSLKELTTSKIITPTRSIVSMQILNQPLPESPVEEPKANRRQSNVDMLLLCDEKQRTVRDMLNSKDVAPCHRKGKAVPHAFHVDRTHGSGGGIPHRTENVVVPSKASFTQPRTNELESQSFTSPLFEPSRSVRALPRVGFTSFDHPDQENGLMFMLDNCPHPTESEQKGIEEQFLSEETPEEKKYRELLMAKWVALAQKQFEVELQASIYSKAVVQAAEKVGIVAPGISTFNSTTLKDKKAWSRYASWFRDAKKVRSMFLEQELHFVISHPKMQNEMKLAGLTIPSTEEDTASYQALEKWYHLGVIPADVGHLVLTLIEHNRLHEAKLSEKLRREEEREGTESEEDEPASFSCDEEEFEDAADVIISEYRIEKRLIFLRNRLQEIEEAETTFARMQRMELTRKISAANAASKLLSKMKGNRAKQVATPTIADLPPELRELEIDVFREIVLPDCADADLVPWKDMSDEEKQTELELALVDKDVCEAAMREGLIPVEASLKHLASNQQNFQAFVDWWATPGNATRQAFLTKEAHDAAQCEAIREEAKETGFGLDFFEIVSTKLKAEKLRTSIVSKPGTKLSKKQAAEEARCQSQLDEYHLWYFNGKITRLGFLKARIRQMKLVAQLKLLAEFDRYPAAVFLDVAPSPILPLDISVRMIRYFTADVEEYSLEDISLWYSQHDLTQDDLLLQRAQEEETNRLRRFMEREKWELRRLEIDRDQMVLEDEASKLLNELEAEGEDEDEEQPFESIRSSSSTSMFSEGYAKLELHVKDRWRLGCGLENGDEAEEERERREQDRLRQLELDRLEAERVAEEERLAAERERLALLEEQRAKMKKERYAEAKRIRTWQNDTLAQRQVNAQEQRVAREIAAMTHEDMAMQTLCRRLEWEQDQMIYEDQLARLMEHEYARQLRLERDQEKLERDLMKVEERYSFARECWEIENDEKKQARREFLEELYQPFQPYFNDQTHKRELIGIREQLHEQERAHTATGVMRHRYTMPGVRELAASKAELDKIDSEIYVARTSKKYDKLLGLPINYRRPATSNQSQIYENLHTLSQAYALAEDLPTKYKKSQRRLTPMSSIVKLSSTKYEQEEDLQVNESENVRQLKPRNKKRIKKINQATPEPQNPLPPPFFRGNLGIRGKPQTIAQHHSRGEVVQSPSKRKVSKTKPQLPKIEPLRKTVVAAIPVVKKVKPSKQPVAATTTLAIDSENEKEVVLLRDPTEYIDFDTSPSRWEMDA